MSDEAIEMLIQEKGLTAPRVTPDDVKVNIVDVEYVRHVTSSGKVLRWAVITTKNGFAVVGKPSAAVSVANDNEQVGQEVAYLNSVSELWPLMGYALADRLAANS